MKKVVLLADEKAKSWEFAQKIHSYLLDKYECDVPLQNIEINPFNNKETQMHVPGLLRQKDVYFIQDSDLTPQTWWEQLLLASDLVLNASAKSLTFVLPDMYYSRQDRKHKHHVPISARAVAASISPGLRRIITMELHSPQIQGFYPKTLPVDNLYSFPEAARHLTKDHPSELENLVIVAPDAGGADRAESFVRRLERIQEENRKNGTYGIAFILKKRKKAGEIERMQLVGDVAGKNVLIVDDIIDSGGTLCAAAKSLKEHGAEKLMCYAAHGIFSKGARHLVKNFDSVMCSNTHTITEKKIEIVDVSPLFAEAIYRAQNGLSISKLFE